MTTKMVFLLTLGVIFMALVVIDTIRKIKKNNR